MKIYISCSLTHLPRNVFHEYVTFIHNLADTLKKHGHSVKYALVDSDPQLAGEAEKDKARLCYLWDKEKIIWSDLVIAEASFPSLGVGIELQLAQFQNIPAIICYKDFGDNKANSEGYKNPDNLE